MIRRYSLCVALALGFSCSAPRIGWAGYASAFEQVTVDGSSTSHSVLGDTSAYDSYSVAPYGSGRARAGGPTALDPRALLGAQAMAYSGSIGEPPQPANVVRTLVDAQWNDTVYLDGPVPAGSFLRFSISLSVDYVNGNYDPEDSGSYYRGGVAILNEGRTASGADVVRSAFGIFSNDPNLANRSGDWDRFLHTLHMDVPLAPGDALTGVQWKFELQALAEAADAGVDSNVYDTAGLQALLIGTADGRLVTPESLGLHVRFASGLPSPNAAVPEPSSLSLMGLGVAGLLAFGRGRRVAGR